MEAFDLFVSSISRRRTRTARRSRFGEASSRTGGHGNCPWIHLPKGIAPAAPIIIDGLTTGSNEQSETSRVRKWGRTRRRTEEGAIKTP